MMGSKTRPYFNDTNNNVHRQVFRTAMCMHAKLGMEELLYHVPLNKDIPPV